MQRHGLRLRQGCDVEKFAQRRLFSGLIRGLTPDSTFFYLMIRENPSAARGVAGAPKNRQRIWAVLVGT